MGLVTVANEHQIILKSLLKDFAAQPVGRTYLMTGPAGIGKRAAAHSLAQFLLCQNYPQVCGACSSCLRVEKRFHESLLFIEPTHMQIRMEEARNILDFLSLKGLSRYRIIIINEAHRLNAAAANSLLKILEEPPEDCFFFLITASPSLMLSTIRSRSLRVHFQPTSMRMPLQLEDNEIELWSEELLHFLQNVDILTDTGWRDQLKDRDLYAQRLSFWMELLRDVIFLSEEDLLLRKKLKPLLQKLKQLPAEKIQLAFSWLLDFQRDLTFNRDPVLMSEQFIVEMKSQAVIG